MILEVTASIIALLALLVSYASYRNTTAANKEQFGLTARETEYVRLMIERERKEAQANLEADLSARVFKQGKNDWRIKIFNKGPCTATNVRVELLADNSWLSEQQLSELFPMKSMEPQQSVETYVPIVMSSARKEIIRLHWDDRSSTGRTKEVELTI